MATPNLENHLKNSKRAKRITNLFFRIFHLFRFCGGRSKRFLLIGLLSKKMFSNLFFKWKVVIDHNTDLVNINSASEQISGYENSVWAVLEATKDFASLCCLEGSMSCTDREAFVQEFPSENLDFSSSVTKDHTLNSMSNDFNQKRKKGTWLIERAS